MTASNENQVEREGGIEDDQQPEVYSVDKDLTGWKFSRRGFIAAAATATAGIAAATAAASASDPAEAISGEAGVVEAGISLEVATAAMRAAEPGRSFSQAWTFTNHSDTTWCKGATLHFANASLIQAPASISVPDIAPGQTVDVQVEMVAPTTPGVYRTSWTLQSPNNIAPVSYGSFVIQSTCIIESSHPHESNSNQTWTVENPDLDADTTRVHFARVDLEPDQGYLVLKDESGEEHQRITGNHPSGLWSSPISGSRIQVQLITDAADAKWGFCLDQVDAAHLIYMPLVMKAAPTPTPGCLAESPHPYSNNMDQTWTVTNPDSAAQGSRVHFSRLEVESGWDYVHIRDSQARTYQSISGDYPSGLWSDPVVGRVVQVHLETDGSITEWGFCVDGIETTGAPPTPCASHCSCVGHCTCDSHCSCDSYCTCVPVHYWYPN